MTNRENLSILKTDPDQIKAEIERAKRALVGVTELAEPLAAARWAHYTASLEKGFDQEQAFELATLIEI